MLLIFDHDPQPRHRGKHVRHPLEFLVTSNGRPDKTILHIFIILLTKNCWWQFSCFLFLCCYRFRWFVVVWLLLFVCVLVVVVWLFVLFVYVWCFFFLFLFFFSFFLVACIFVFLDRHFTLGQINFWMLFIYLSLCFGCFLWILPNPIHFSAWTAEWLLLLVVQRYRSQQMLLQSNHDLPLMRTSAVPLSPLHPFRPTPRTTATFVTTTTTTPLSMPACGKSESRCAKWIC